MFKPRIISVIRGERGDFTREQIKNDIKGGLNVAIISLPIAIALGISSGLSPEMGIFTTIIGGLVAALLGGSGVQITGITSGFVLVCYGLISKYGIGGMAIAAIMGGLILIVLGLLNLGSVIKYIPYSVTVGFTTGIGILLITTEVPSFFGLHIKNLPNDIVGKWILYIKNISTLNIEALAIAILAVLIVVFWPKINKTIPSSLVAIIITSLISIIFKLKVDTIFSAFGHISTKIPMPKIPHISIGLIGHLIVPAITIALIGSITSLLAALVGDGLTGERHDSNTELVGLGVANIVSALFGGIPVAGVVSRTTANFRYGSRTPFGAIFHSGFLFIIMIVFMPLAEYIPLAALSGIIMVLGYNMIKVKVLKELLLGPKMDFVLALVTAILIPLISIPVAIGVAMIIAMTSFMVKMSKHLEVKEVKGISTKDIKVDERILVYEITGALFFGTVEILMDGLDEIKTEETEVLILRLKNINNIDATVINQIKVIYERSLKHNIKLILSGLKKEDRELFENKGYRSYENINDALEKAKSLIK